MKTTQYFMISGLLVLGIVAQGATATAQNRRRQREMPQVQFERPMLFDGEVVQIKMPYLYARSIDKSEWVIKLEPEVPEDITLSGKAKPSWLRPGMLLQFEAMLDKRYTGQKPVKAFQVLMSHPDRAPGVTQDPPVSADDVPEALVVGEFVRLRGGFLFVRAGKRTVKVQPAEDAVIEVAMFGPRVLEVLRAGDKVLGKISPVKGVPGQAKAKKLEFQGAKVFGKETDPKPPRRKTTRRRRPADNQGGEDHRDKQSEESEEGSLGEGAGTKRANRRVSAPRSSRSV